ncbi:ATP-dependent DNA helicase [Bacillus salacetis]|uniref:ATP-dependent DNA helicase n=1 Tax=Bacillus salacetis TaxID=2315464 RepID=A0A3A1R290_9BACI|nr:ATP-dependent DNA helicase [Bacillus salacetis]RIW33300.1 ATP-dependent DNA helicase [Bacillus salacetis]
MVLKEIKVSVRNLVEYVYKTGSIDQRFQTSSSMTEGTRLHKKIQKTYKEGDLAEEYLSRELPYEELVFTVEGRCDGLIFEGDSIIIDEIKSTRSSLADLHEEAYPVHWAQGKVYAFIYAKDHGLEKISVRLTYISVDTEETLHYLKTFTISQLEDFALTTIKEYYPFAKLIAEHKEKRNQTAEEIGFPFREYRKGQRNLAGAVYKTITEKKTLFANAPTGTGKTISTIFPSVKAMGKGSIDKLYYLTAKTITRTTAEEAFELLESRGLAIKTLTITAKDKACLQDEPVCQSDVCEFANGYYDRINGAILDILGNETRLTRPVIEKYSRKHRVCPFEFSIDLSYIADAVICDYNYIYDPRVSLKRLTDSQKKRTVLLTDEAHNLVDRGRSMFSAELKKTDFLELSRSFKDQNKEVSSSAKEINRFFIDLRKRCEENRTAVYKEQFPELIDYLQRFLAAAETELIGQSGESVLLDTYFAANNFVKAASLYNEKYVTYVDGGKKEVTVRLYCLDPSDLLSQTSRGFSSAVFFSATLLPFHYYFELLGGVPGDYRFKIPSPFPHENWDVRIKPLSTRYKDREKTIVPLVRLPQELLKQNPGNYLYFFPSYRYMNEVYEAFMDELPPHTDVLVQASAMTEEDREGFLKAFQHNRDKSLIGFAVLGGIFSEGVDLKGDRLNGVIVVGVGLPQLGADRDIIKNHFNAAGKSGYDYSYVFPGMNKVLQAGGRLIRTEEDTGVIVLVDDRYLTPKYRAMLPEEWQDFTVI